MAKAQAAGCPRLGEAVPTLCPLHSGLLHRWSQEPISLSIQLRLGDPSLFKFILKCLIYHTAPIKNEWNKSFLSSPLPPTSSQFNKKHFLTVAIVDSPCLTL